MLCKIIHSPIKWSYYGYHVRQMLFFPLLCIFGTWTLAGFRQCPWVIPGIATIIPGTTALRNTPTYLQKPETGPMPAVLKSKPRESDRFQNLTLPDLPEAQTREGESMGSSVQILSAVHRHLRFHSPKNTDLQHPSHGSLSLSFQS